LALPSAHTSTCATPCIQPQLDATLELGVLQCHQSPQCFFQTIKGQEVDAIASNGMV